MLATLFLITQLATNTTFCKAWDDMPNTKTIFLLERIKEIKASLIENHNFSESMATAVAICYEKNVNILQNRLDSDCRAEKELTKFFGQQVDTSDQEFQDITDFINKCVDDSTKGAT
jgi:hypothetical protein